MELVTTILAFAHILSAMAWLGGGFMFGFIIAPRLTKLSLASSREFFVSIVPQVLRFFQVVAGLTILFGVLLLYSIISSSGGWMAQPASWRLDIEGGIAVAVVAFLYSEFVAVPVFKDVVALNLKMSADGSNVPAELPRAGRKAGVASLVTLILLLIALGFMATAGFY